MGRRQRGTIAGFEGLVSAGFGDRYFGGGGRRTGRRKDEDEIVCCDNKGRPCRLAVLYT